MRTRPLLVAFGLAFGGYAAAQQSATPAASTQPQIQLAPGLREVPDYRKVDADPPAPKIPEGSTSLFNGGDLTGWQPSQTARHCGAPDSRRSCTVAAWRILAVAESRDQGAAGRREVVP